MATAATVPRGSGATLAGSASAGERQWKEPLDRQSGASAVSRSEPDLVAPPGKTPTPKFSTLAVDMKRHRHPHVAAGRRRPVTASAVNRALARLAPAGWRPQRRAEAETADGTVLADRKLASRSDKARARGRSRRGLAHPSTGKCADCPKTLGRHPRDIGAYARTRRSGAAAAAVARSTSRPAMTTSRSVALCGPATDRLPNAPVPPTTSTVRAWPASGCGPWDSLPSRA